VKRLPLIGAVALAVLCLSSCGTGTAVNDARAACRIIHRGLAEQKASLNPHLTSAQRNALQSQALGTVLSAQRDAANATTADGSWNPLQTTIEEANRVPLRYEVVALTRICQVADSSSPYLV